MYTQFIYSIYLNVLEILIIYKYSLLTNIDIHYNNQTMLRKLIVFYYLHIFLIQKQFSADIAIENY